MEGLAVLRFFRAVFAIERQRGQCRQRTDAGPREAATSKVVVKIKIWPGLVPADLTPCSDCG